MHLVTSAWLFSLMGTDQQDGCKLLIRCKAGPGRKLMALRRVANNIKEKSRSIDGHDLIAKCTPDLKSCNSCLSVGNSDFLSCFHRWCYVSRYSKKTQAAACKHVYVYTHAVMDFSCSSDHVQNREISHIYCSLIFVVCVSWWMSVRLVHSKTGHGDFGFNNFKDTNLVKQLWKTHVVTSQIELASAHIKTGILCF